ncbi:MAG TPA: hypothetical protein VOA87_02080 [Thermoanaerobaculia bacterium]|nr:hypothetical protein [Thermoanaerobaculia bacterium]
MPLPRLLLAATLLLAAAPRLSAAGLPCEPCAGLRLEAPAAEAPGPAAIVEALKAPPGLKPGSPLYIAWEVEVGGGKPAAPGSSAPGAGEIAAKIAAAGGTPWLSLVFRTPPPFAGAAASAARLQGELQAAAEIAAAAPAGTIFQIEWRPEGLEDAPLDVAAYAFLLKRAAVAVTGAKPEGKVATEPLPADPAVLAKLFGEEVAAYLDALVLVPGTPEEIAAAAAAAEKDDPGSAIVLDALPLPADRQEVLAEAARWTVRGIDLTLFRAAAPDAASLVPFALLAREFAGDITYDADSTPTGATEAWAFVRGKDLGVRVIARVPEGANELVLNFADGTLRRPVRFPLAPGRVPPPAGQVTASGLEIRLADPGRVAVLGLDRPTAEERKGVAEKVTVSGQREIPLEEILRRLQAFEDAQGRRLENYRATNTTHLRFQFSGTAQSLDAALEGPFFFRAGAGTDWAWKNLYLNGVRWKGKSIPEIPLVQPEKAAALPLEIHFNKEYRYRLRGTARVDGRDAWVVDFSPASADASREKLYSGSVWIDRQLYARLQTRAVQVGLKGEVLSNEETWHYQAVDARGRTVPWAQVSADAFVLPLHLVGQQILSVVNSATVVERETVLSDLRINDPDFETAKKSVEASDATMVRDTDKGLRYLVKDEKNGGQRVVKEGFATSKLFAVGGAFYDNSLAFPLPLAGVNYFTFDYKGTGDQVNVFFAGALLTASVAQPRLLGSRFDLGGSAFALALPQTDTLFRNNHEVTDEEIKSLPATARLKLGRPLGDFVKLDLEYGLFYSHYGRTKNTAPDFVLPADNLLQSLSLGAQFARGGYRVKLDGSYNDRSRWKFWGLPGNTEFDPRDKDFVRWDAAVAKSWYLPLFQKIGAEVDYNTGSSLDRFSKLQFGFFGDTRVHGYQSNRVRASEALSGHLTYGFELGETLRIDAVGDLALATDRETGLNHEKLAGVGLAGTFMGPWETLVNMDIGFPVAGPDSGVVAYIAFLKLFH